MTSVQYTYTTRSSILYGMHTSDKVTTVSDVLHTTDVLCCGVIASES
jgi:hypothetical protein